MYTGIFDWNLFSKGCNCVYGVKSKSFVVEWYNFSGRCRWCCKHLDSFIFTYQFLCNVAALDLVPPKESVPTPFGKSWTCHWIKLLWQVCILFFHHGFLEICRVVNPLNVSHNPPNTSTIFKTIQKNYTLQ